MYLACRDFQLVHFADDTTGFASSNSIENVVNLVNSNLCSLYSWLNSNRFCLSINKTNFVIFGKENPNLNQICIKISDNIFE